MSLRIVYGRAGSGKTTLVLNEMKSRLEKINSGAGLHHDMLVLLVPEQFSFQAEKSWFQLWEPEVFWTQRFLASKGWPTGF